MFKISIPKPCHEDWDAMSPNEQGRHCGSCAKTVVDFTGMSDEEVKYFFLNKKERVCGRFMPAQLQHLVIDLPQNIFSIEMPVWKKFLLACLVAFSVTLFSCDTRIDGKLFQQVELAELSKTHGEPVIERTMGIPRSQPDTSLPVVTVVGFTAPKIVTDPIEIKGDVAYVPTDTIKPKTCERPLMGVPAMILVGRDTPLIKQKVNPDCDKKIYQ